MHHSEAQRGHGEAQSKAVEAHRYQKRPDFRSPRGVRFIRRRVGGAAAVMVLLLFNTTRAHSLRTVLLLLNTTRTTSGPPSTGAAIAMDGGVADTQPAITQAVSRRRF